VPQTLSTIRRFSAPGRFRVARRFRSARGSVPRAASMARGFDSFDSFPLAMRGFRTISRFRAGGCFRLQSLLCLLSQEASVHKRPRWQEASCHDTHLVSRGTCFDSLVVYVAFFRSAHEVRSYRSFAKRFGVNLVKRGWIRAKASNLTKSKSTWLNLL
jgi:hypothetical protein